MTPSRRLPATILAIVALVYTAPIASATEPTRVTPGSDVVVDFAPLEGLAPAAAVEVDFDDAYDADPLGLVAYREFTTMFTDGSETWDVYICRPPGETPLGLQLGSVVTTLNGMVADYYDTISEGRYRPVFEGRGTSTDPDCGIGQTHSGTTPRMYVNDFTVLEDNRDSAVGQGSPGTISWNGTSLFYEGLQRRAEIDGAAVLEIAAYEYSPAGSIAAHEIGHTLHWAHSGAAGDYDNEIDLMSLGWGGTHAFNLYSAGWIDLDQVSMHHGGTRTYTMGPVGFDGTRMVVVTTGTEGLFYVLSVRDGNDPVLDANSEPVVDEPGVEVYLVDQRPAVCAQLPEDSPCFGIVADVTPFPAVPATFPGPYAHFHPVGSDFSIEGVAVTVADSGSGTLSVTVDGGLSGSGLFIDDDDSVFQADIEWAALQGITLGCNPPTGDRFCPNDPVTRGQMAAFLVRTLGLTAADDDYFSDDTDSVFQADINALAASGITRGCTPTTFCPEDPVTRGQMAAFLTRAYDLQASDTDAFTDDTDSVFQADINALAASGITKGCTDTTFCPGDLVTRGQMAAFLKRASSR